MKFKLEMDGGEEEISMAPLIDMVFLLLIFFMVASHLNQLDKVEIDVPVADHAKVAEDMSDRRTITVKADGTVYLGSVPSSLEKIGPQVEKERRIVPGLKIYLRADKNTPHHYVRDVMKTCAANGASEILFATYERE
jgi:biopolymer transport protein ExbD